MPQPQNHAFAPAPQTALIDLDKFNAASLQTAPFDYVIVPAFIYPAVFDSIVKDYPDIKERGSFSLSTLTYGPVFRQLLDELSGDAFRDAVAKKFSVDLTGTPKMITVRGACGKKDGSVHTDTESKILSLLLYMNPAWEKEGGRLRLLGSRNIDDVVTEVPPEAGTLLIFRRADNSFHGHKPFVGPRKVVQLNWITDEKFADRNDARHRWSSFIKKLNPFASEY